MTEIKSMLLAIDEMREPSPQTVAFAMIANEISTVGHGLRRERLLTRWRQIGNYPIGRLGIPLDNYGRCAYAMAEARETKSIVTFVTEVSNYIARATEVIRTASHDRFHWARLDSTILPAEPEAVAMTAAMWISSRSTLRDWLGSRTDLDEHGRMLFQIGEGLAEIGRRNERNRG